MNKKIFLTVLLIWCMGGKAQYIGQLDMDLFSYGAAEKTKPLGKINLEKAFQEIAEKKMELICKDVPVNNSSPFSDYPDEKSDSSTEFVASYYDLGDEYAEDTYPILIVKNKNDPRQFAFRVIDTWVSNFVQENIDELVEDEEISYEEAERRLLEKAIKNNDYVMAYDLNFDGKKELIVYLEHERRYVTQGIFNGETGEPLNLFPPLSPFVNYEETFSCPTACLNRIVEYEPFSPREYTFYEEHKVLIAEYFIDTEGEGKQVFIFNSKDKRYELVMEGERLYRWE